jgi:hypothetical protein
MRTVNLGGINGRDMLRMLLITLRRLLRLVNLPEIPCNGKHSSGRFFRVIDTHIKGEKTPRSSVAET